MRGLAFVCALLGGAVTCAVACASFDSAGDTSDGGGDVDAGAACTPPACGGAGGRCGKIQACGLEFSCGDCAPPYGCVDGTCRCTAASTSELCSAAAATCGDVDDGCGQLETCGACEAGTTCQSLDAGLSCATGGCTPEPISTSCKDKCKKATNNCGTVVPCAGCAGNKLCAADGKANTCACPPRTSPIVQYYDANESHLCYTQATACPGARQGAIAKIYAAASDGLTLLYRCRLPLSPTASSFFLTTSASCEGLKGYLLEGAIGACTTSTACGATPLYRYYRPGGGGDFVVSLAPTSPLPGYVPFGIACNVWAP